MQVLLIFVASLVAYSSALNLSYVLPDGERWYVKSYLYDDDDSSKGINRSLVKSELEMIMETPDVVKFYLYTETNPTEGKRIIKGDASSLHQSKFNSSNPTRIMVHGYKSSHKTELCTLIRDVYLRKGPVNFICIDWSIVAYKSMVTARLSIPSIGRELAEFIQFLCQSGGMSNKDLIVIAHSYGTHIAGYSGKYLKEFKNPLPLIVACDPAHPLFSYEDCSLRICNTDADFVMSIQTTAGSIGYKKPIGDGAYYPNGGANQPACSSKRCNHMISYKYFVEAVEYDDFPVKRCNSYKNALSKHCEKNYTSFRMGSEKSFRTKGVFYVPVNSKSPYGKGSKQ